MDNLNAVRFRSAVALSLVVLTIFSSAILPGKGIVSVTDQQCSTTNELGTTSIGDHEPIGQTFTPTQSSVVGFSIYISSQNGLPTPMTAKILTSGIGGTLAGSKNFSVPVGFGPGWFSVSFDSGIAVTPGNAYALDLKDNLASSGIKLFQCSDNYAGGHGYSEGTLGISSYTFTETAGTFSVGVAPTTLSIVQGLSGNSTITVTSYANFTSPVHLGASGVPVGVSVAFGSGTLAPPSDSLATTSISVMVTGAAAVGSYAITITGTSGAETPNTTLTLTVASAATVTVTTSATSNMSTTSTSAADFAITSSASSIFVSQGGSGSATIVVVSLNGFNSPVSLSASWVGTAPAGVSESVTSPVVPVSGSAASSPLTITATSGASVGNFTVRVIGTSGMLTHIVTPDITVQIMAVSMTSSTMMGSTTSSPSSTPPTCAVAIATFGSEVAPLVQGLRKFRDQSIMKTRSGFAFMTIFNAWYYSFSPNLARNVGANPIERSTLKYALYPVIGILYASYYSYLLFSPLSGEVGVIVAGMIGATLLGLVYLAPVGYLVKRALRRYGRSSLLATHVAAYAGISTMLVPVAYFTNSPFILGIVTANLTFSMLSLGGILGAKRLTNLPVTFKNVHTSTLVASVSDHLFRSSK